MAIWDKFQFKSFSKNANKKEASEATTEAPKSVNLPPHVAKALKLDGKAKKGDKLRSPKFRARHFKLPAGAKWNPLRKYPVNKPCFCGSGRKSKKCCAPHLSSCVSTEFATYINRNWDKFLTGQLKLPAAKLPIPEKSE